MGETAAFYSFINERACSVVPQNSQRALDLGLFMQTAGLHPRPPPPHNAASWSTFLGAFPASWLVWFVDVLRSTEPEKAPAVCMRTECGVCGVYFSYALSGYIQVTTANIFLLLLKQNKKICHREPGTSSVCTYCDM